MVWVNKPIDTLSHSHVMGQLVQCGNYHHSKISPMNSVMQSPGELHSRKRDLDVHMLVIQQGITAWVFFVIAM